MTGRHVLRGQASLHAAVVSDRFRLNADLSKSAPLFLKGAGTASAQPDEIWASDGASLLTFHNGALRLVNPSVLQPTKEDVIGDGSRRKRREQSIDSNGHFKPKYPIDHALKNVRHLK